MPATNILSGKAIKAAVKAATAASEPITKCEGGGQTLICRPAGARWWPVRYGVDSRKNRPRLATYLCRGPQRVERDVDHVPAN